MFVASLQDAGHLVAHSRGYAALHPGLVSFRPYGTRTARRDSDGETGLGQRTARPIAVCGGFEQNWKANLLDASSIRDTFYTDAVNYGAIGVVIGHEISHGFDDQGAQFDSTGRLD